MLIADGLRGVLEAGLVDLSSEEREAWSDDTRHEAKPLRDESPPRNRLESVHNTGYPEPPVRTTFQES